MQFMNSSQDALVKNLSEIEFRYLSQEKQKAVYPY